VAGQRPARVAGSLAAPAPAPNATRTGGGSAAVHDITADDAFASQLGVALARLGAPLSKGLRLRNSLTLHDGVVVSLAGDATPLGADEDVRIVTTTTTVLDHDRMRVETTCSCSSTMVARLGHDPARRRPRLPGGRTARPGRSAHRS
jgi:hypothetical protein